MLIESLNRAGWPAACQTESARGRQSRQLGHAVGWSTVWNWLTSIIPAFNPGPFHLYASLLFISFLFETNRDFRRINVGLAAAPVPRDRSDGPEARGGFQCPRQIYGDCRCSYHYWIILDHYHMLWNHPTESDYTRVWQRCQVGACLKKW